MFLIWNINESIIEYLDAVELRKIKKLYGNGKLCGNIKKKIII